MLAPQKHRFAEAQIRRCMLQTISCSHPAAHEAYVALPQTLLPANDDGVNEALGSGMQACRAKHAR